jgi:hypothetical protein
MRKTMIVILLLIVMPALASADPGRLPASKKLIEYGWDVPFPAFVAENIRQMEKRPFDGIIMRLEAHRGNVFTGGKWDPADFAADIKALQSIQWGKFKTNFLIMYSVSDHDWFSDSDWANVVNNVEIMARCAKAGGCYLAFDAEPYGAWPWDYKHQKHAHEKSFTEYAAKARERGRQFSEAIGRIIPDNVLLTFFSYLPFSRNPNTSVSDPVKREQGLSREPYGLYLPFLNGMLDALGPQMTITDGNEFSYYYASSENFLAGYHMMRQSALDLIPRELVPKFQTNTQASQALYMNYVFGKVPWKANPSLYMTPEEQAKWFEFNTYWALKTTDEFVWCYTEKMSWWTNKDIPPGMEEAIVRARTAFAENHPCGVDIKSLMQTAQARREAAPATTESKPVKSN